jgi:hypothetical protein
VWATLEGRLGGGRPAEVVLWAGRGGEVARQRRRPWWREQVMITIAYDCEHVVKDITDGAGGTHAHIVREINVHRAVFLSIKEEISTLKLILLMYFL